MPFGQTHGFISTSIQCACSGVRKHRSIHRTLSPCTATALHNAGYGAEPLQYLKRHVGVGCEFDAKVRTSRDSCYVTFSQKHKTFIVIKAGNEATRKSQSTYRTSRARCSHPAGKNTKQTTCTEDLVINPLPSAVVRTAMGTAIEASMLQVHVYYTCWNTKETPLKISVAYFYPSLVPRLSTHISNSGKPGNEANFTLLLWKTSLPACLTHLSCTG